MSKKRRGTALTSRLLVAAMVVPASAFAFTYCYQSMAGYDHVDSIDAAFTNNAVGANNRACAGQAHTGAGGGDFYGSYLCGPYGAAKSYPLDYRRARAHNGIGSSQTVAGGVS